MSREDFRKIEKLEARIAKVERIIVKRRSTINKLENVITEKEKNGQPRDEEIIKLRWNDHRLVELAEEYNHIQCRLQALQA